MGYFLVKYEYKPRKFAFGQLEDGKSGPRMVKPTWYTRRRHLPEEIEISKLILGTRKE